MSSTRSPFSRPHSYTRILPYGESTSRDSGSAFGGYDSPLASIDERFVIVVSLGEGSGLRLTLFGELDIDRSKIRLPRVAAPTPI